MRATEIADAVNARGRSAADFARETLARVAAYDAVQPQIWIERLPDAAVLDYAAAVDKRVAAGESLPLAGVPFAIKDNIDLAGLPTTAACPEFAYRPERSATVVERLIAAGAVPIGKTNLDQFATGLNGTRSPYGAPGCVFNRTYVSGGSSSGSAVAVGAGLVPIALGTDTAGSGRVPAAFNNLIGLKPSKGRWSTNGLFPACRSLDCISVFTNDVADARLVDEIVAGFDPEDAYSRALPDRSLGKRLGVPLAAQLNWCGDLRSAALYEAAVGHAREAGYEIVPVDIGFLGETAALLYQGPWVAERAAAVGSFLQNSPDAIHPVVRNIVEAGIGVTGVEAFRGQYRLQQFAQAAARMWEQVDALLLPTAPTIYRIREILAEPVALNSNLGFYTNFVNLLDMSAVAIPAGFRANSTAFGVTLIAPAGADRALLDMADGLLAAAPPTLPPPLDLEGLMETVQLAVVGAHLKDMPLHWQLSSREARLMRATKTAPNYRLYAMANSTPPKPALIHSKDGAAIEIEVYELDIAAFGSFVAEVAAPLAIGTVTLEDGSEVKGFVAEPRALDGAQDITAFGGWRAFVGSR
jgi:allophanate hydrolase